MKKFLFSAILGLGSTLGFAQTLDEIKIMISLNQVAKAKEGIDKFLAVPKNQKNNDAQYYKGRIYAAVAREAGQSTVDVSKNYGIALEALKAYQAGDAKEELLKDESYASFMDAFGGFYNNGVKAFGEKDFKTAFSSFESAISTGEYIKMKKYSFSNYDFNNFDTSLVLNTANAAMQAVDTANALKYYKKIMDAGVAGPDYENIYEMCAQIYASKKDMDNYRAIEKLGRAKYPNSKFWDGMELDLVSAGGDKEALFAKYEDVYKKDPTNKTTSFNYAVELFNYIYKGDNDGVLDTVKADKITQVLTGLLPDDKDNSVNGFLASHLYNYAANFSTRAAAIKIPANPKLAKPADVKAKKALEQKSFAKMDEYVKVAEKSIVYFGSLPTLKAKEKATYHQVAGNLAEVYKIRGNVKRSLEMEKIRSSIKF
jgi:hypothetical protein